MTFTANNDIERSRELMIARYRLLIPMGLVALAIYLCANVAQAALPQVVRDAQNKMVKIYGSGGFKGLEAYQSGFLISAEGHILTTYSYVLDADYITATLDDGHKYGSQTTRCGPKT